MTTEAFHIIAIDLRQQQKFPLGQGVITANAAQHLDTVAVREALRRHAAGDWGELYDEDRQENEQAVTSGGCLLSVYRTSTDIKFWIITETDRSVTTILLPLDY